MGVAIRVFPGHWCGNWSIQLVFIGVSDASTAWIEIYLY